MTSPVDGPSDVPTDFAAFYGATVTRVLGIAHRTAAGELDLAWDATQEAYARMLERWPDRRWQCREDNRRYTTAIAVNLVIDAYRPRGRRTELDDEHDRGMEDSALEAVLDEMALLGAVRDFLHRQPARRRAVGVLFLIEGLTRRRSPPHSVWPNRPCAPMSSGSGCCSNLMWIGSLRKSKEVSGRDRRREHPQVGPPSARR